MLLNDAKQSNNNSTYKYYIPWLKLYKIYLTTHKRKSYWKIYEFYWIEMFILFRYVLLLKRDCKFNDMKDPIRC
jgi:hypothetical protein